MSDCLSLIDEDRFQMNRSLSDSFDIKEVFDYYREYNDQNFLKPLSAKRRTHFDLTTLTPNTDQIDRETPFYNKNICFTGKLDTFTRKEGL